MNGSYFLETTDKAPPTKNGDIGKQGYQKIKVPGSEVENDNDQTDESAGTTHIRIIGSPTQTKRERLSF